MFSIRILLSVTVLFFAHGLAFAADVNSLSKLFIQNYNSIYESRMCGKNIERFLELSVDRNVNLTNAYVLKITGAGFLETSGFYTRNQPNEWKMLGYFHFILVADGYAFDFDLHEPLVLPIHDYVRLQFTPPYEPYRALGNVAFTTDDLKYWKVEKTSVQDFLSRNGKSEKLSLNQVVSISALKKLKRVR